MSGPERSKTREYPPGPTGGPQNRLERLEVPAPAGWINSNQRLHRMAVAKLTKAWREAGATAAEGIEPFTGLVHITAHISKPRAGRWDPNNLWPTVKAAVDGMVDAGLLVDDDWEHVIGPDMRRGPKGPACLVVEIEEIVGEIVQETPQDEGKCSKIGHISNGLSGSSQ